MAANPKPRKRSPSSPKSDAERRTTLPPAHGLDRPLRQEQRHDQQGAEVHQLPGVDDALRELLEVIGDRQVLDQLRAPALERLAEPADGVEDEEREERA